MSYFIANVPGEEMIRFSFASEPDNPANMRSNAAASLAASSCPAGVNKKAMPRTGQKPRAELLLECLHLTANGAVGHAQIARSKDHRSGADMSFEGLQTAQRGKTTSRHVTSPHSMSGLLDCSAGAKIGRRLIASEENQDDEEICRTLC